MAAGAALRDWLKGQVTAVEAGIMPAEVVFLPHLLTAAGRPVAEVVLSSTGLLPPALEEVAA